MNHPCHHLEAEKVSGYHGDEMRRRVVLSTFQDDASLSLPPVLVGSSCGHGDCFKSHPHSHLAFLLSTHRYKDSWLGLQVREDVSMAQGHDLPGYPHLAL